MISQVFRLIAGLLLLASVGIIGIASKRPKRHKTRWNTIQCAVNVLASFRGYSLSSSRFLFVPPHFNRNTVTLAFPKQHAAGVAQQPFPELGVLEDLFVGGEELEDSAGSD